MNSAHSYFLISILLITALVAICVLLIIATEQPDSLLEGRRRIVLPRIGTPPSPAPPPTAATEQNEQQNEVDVDDNHSRHVHYKHVGKPQPAGGTTSPPNLPPVHSPVGPAVHHRTLTTARLDKAKERPTLEIITAIQQKQEDTFAIPKMDTSIQAPLEKFAEFGPSEGGKFMGIQLVGTRLYLAKDDGRIEVRDAAQLTLVRVLSTGMRIHRLRAVNERIFVLLDASFTRLVLYDAAVGVVLQERKLAQPAKELALDDAIVYTLGRFEGRIDAFDLDDLRPLANQSIDLGPTERNCNFVAGDRDQFLLVSCGTSILQVAKKDGSILRQFSAPCSNYAALLCRPDGNVVAVNKSQRELQLFNGTNGQLIARMGHTEGTRTMIWIWTALALNPHNGTLLTLEYISNRVEVFALPSNVPL